MSDTYNQWRFENNESPDLPNFEKYTTSIRISEQSYNGLIRLANLLGYKKSLRKSNVSLFLEALGLGALRVTRHNSIDMTAYESGRQDALEGRPAEPTTSEIDPKDSANIMLYHFGYHEQTFELQSEHEKTPPE